MSDPDTSEPAVPRLLEVIARLRGEGGCPWDREQTLVTLKRYLIEESYELLDAIESGDPARHCEELGDVLLQVVLQAQIRKEEGAFSFQDVAAALTDKLIRRHPHVFGDVKVSSSAEVLRNWDQIKSAEKKVDEAALLGGLPRHLPALQKAERVQSRVARVGFDWEKVQDVVTKVEEELREVKDELAGTDRARLAEELGDLLFSVVNLCRFVAIHPEDALAKTTAKFSARFGEVERRVRQQGRQLKDCSLAELDALWEQTKRRPDAP